MKGVNHPDQGDDGKDIAEDQAEAIDPPEDKMLSHKRDRAMISLRRDQKRKEPENRRRQHDGLPRDAFHKEKEKGGNEKEGSGMNPLNHVVLRSSSPASSAHILKLSKRSRSAPPRPDRKAR